jgi:hypothetical protein
MPHKVSMKLRLRYGEFYFKVLVYYDLVCHATGLLLLPPYFQHGALLVPCQGIFLGTGPRKGVTPVTNPGTPGGDTDRRQFRPVPGAGHN